jgi:tetratricopeptide (TPR) repeat protein
MDPMRLKTPKERLEQLLNLALVYRGWNRKQLASALHRDATKLVPASGLPKIDFVMALTRVLDWSVEDVATHLVEDEPVGLEDGTELLEDFDALEEQSKTAHREGRHMDAVRLARAAFEAARDREQRALACVRESSGWDGLGRYAQALEATTRGLAEGSARPDRRLMLQVNLAGEYYTLWRLVEARSIAHELVERFEETSPATRIERVVHAFAYYVRGNTYRRMMAVEEHDLERCARRAISDLTTATELYETLAVDFDEEAYRGVANTCRGGRLEAETAIGERSAADALAELARGLDDLIDPNEFPVGDWLESHGWWCIFGCNIALRHVTDERELQQHMALFTMKADEIAERLNNWALRERVFTLDHARRQRFANWTGVESVWTIDRDDVRVITGTMARFPAFQPIGWQILESARIVEEN